MSTTKQLFAFEFCLARERRYLGTFHIALLALNAVRFMCQARNRAVHSEKFFADLGVALRPAKNCYNSPRHELSPLNLICFGGPSSDRRNFVRRPAMLAPFFMSSWVFPSRGGRGRWSPKGVRAAFVPDAFVRGIMAGTYFSEIGCFRRHDYRHRPPASSAMLSWDVMPFSHRMEYIR